MPTTDDGNIKIDRNEICEKAKTFLPEILNKNKYCFFGNRDIL